MRTYRNVKTGAVIEIASELTGSAWVEVLPQPVAVPVIEVEEPVKPKRSGKKKGETNGSNHNK